MKRTLYVIVITLCSAVLSHPQTIADLAREQRARKSQTATTTITTSMVKPAAPAAEDPKTTDAKDDAKDVATEPAAEATEPAAKPAEARDEKWWRGEFAKARTEIKRAEDRILILDTDYKAANRDYLTRAYDPTQKGMATVAEMKAKLETAKQDLEKANAKAAQLEDDLRRAGAPAGWAR